MQNQLLAIQSAFEPRHSAIQIRSFQRGSVET